MSDEELSPELRRLVDLAREGRTPGEGDKLRIAERLAVPLAAGVVAGSAAGTAKAASAGLFSSWALKVAAVVALGAAGTLAVVSQREAPPAPAASAQKPAPRVAPAPLAPPVEAAPAPVRVGELPPAEPAPAKPEPASPHGAKPAHELAQEAALLHEAQAAWRAGQSAQALKLANLHAQRFPKSQLANERDVLRVLSLCKLGRAQAAKQVGARLLRQAKGSPWYQSVAESCAGN